MALLHATLKERIPFLPPCRFVASLFGLKSIDDTLYDAALMEQLLKQWPEKNAAIGQVVEDMDLQEYVFPHMYQDYSLPLNNCKDFVRDFDYRYRLAGGKFQ